MVKICALRERLHGRRQIVSDAIQAALSSAFGLPADKRAHRFFPLEREDLLAPRDRSDDYTLLELTVMAGRSTHTKKALVRALFERLEQDAGLRPQDVEIVILEAPPENWGFRGLHGDEAQLSYKVRA
jgi:phenylpyruvate tautomerase PptA (4-oxalocrotonate tautomerase family)